jgi:hypothetical protein
MELKGFDKKDAIRHCVFEIMSLCSANFNNKIYKIIETELEILTIKCEEARIMKFAKDLRSEEHSD